MNSRFSYALIGLFVLVLGGVFVGVVLWLSAGPVEQHYRTYVAYMRQSVSGLGVNSVVKYLGVDVGRVKSIELDPQNPEQVQLLLQIRPDVPIRKDTVAVLSTQGLTGVTHVELMGTTTDSPPLQAAPGERYPEIKTRLSVFSRLQDALPSLVSEMRSTATNTGEVARRLEELLSESNLRTTGQILDNVHKLTATLSDQAVAISEIVHNVNAASRGAERASAEIPGLLQRADATLAAIDRAAGSVRQAADRIGSFAKQSQQDLEAVGSSSLPQLNATLAEMQQLTDALRRLAQQLEQNPDMLLYGRPKPTPGPGE